MGKIKILDSEVVGHIAAGEVVDRPSTILKELLENALDANATRIEIEIEGGGIDRIVVADNGHGMDEADAAMAIQRHATSKILTLSDLEQINTFGFRGEALASIAAVSKLELLTNQPGSLRGTRVMIEGGETRHVGIAGTPLGTRVAVSALFFNVPARRKFLKSAQTEEASCLEVFGKIALSRTEVAFGLKKSGKIAVTLPAGESLETRYRKLFPATGENQLFPFESTRDSVRVSGILGTPLAARSSRSSIWFYVNKRVVRAGVLSQALLDGYSGYLQPGKFPIAVLFLEVDGKWVDVNVHPTKAEVRFAHPREIYGFIEKSAAMSLKNLQEEVRPRVGTLGTGPSGKLGTGPSGTSPLGPVPNSSGYRSLAPAYSGVRPREGPVRYEDLTLFEKLAPYSVEEKSSPILLGSMAKTYALFKEHDTIFLIDLHVAHERINYDLLESRLQAGARPAQELLTPLVLSLSLAQKSLVEKYGDFLTKMGLTLEEFGADSVLARSVPTGLNKMGEKRSILSLLDKLERIDEVKGPEDTDRKILATMACRSSIQAGDDVSELEMQSLFKKVLETSNPYFCPHGRPIIIKLALEDLHRMFKRTWS